VTSRATEIIKEALGFYWELLGSNLGQYLNDISRGLSQFLQANAVILL
jgi:hypothetical protein